MSCSAAAAKNSRTLNVLVVDDEPLIRWSILETLEARGHQVTEARDAESALRAIADARQPLDVVLLDFRLPDSNDLALLAQIRRLAPTSQVILMTAFGTPELIDGAMNLGAYRVVTKPFEVHAIAALVQQADASRH